MPIQHANAELAARAWLKTVPGLPSNQIGTTLPQDQTSWASTGYIQVITSGPGSSSAYFGYRAPVTTAHFWAVNLNSQQPPWGKCSDLAESLWAELIKDDNGTERLSLGVAGAPDIRVLQAWPVDEIRRLPWGFPSGQGSFIDPGNAAHYTLSFQLAWAELPA
jgi:hypothetical protein